jgi:hypothetical protein
LQVDFIMINLLQQEKRRSRNFASLLLLLLLLLLLACWWCRVMQFQLAQPQQIILVNSPLFFTKVIKLIIIKNLCQLELAYWCAVVVEKKHEIRLIKSRQGFTLNSRERRPSRGVSFVLSFFFLTFYPTFQRVLK